MSKYILVTGSGGLIGSAAVNFFCLNDFQVIGIDNDMRAYYFGNEGSTKSSVARLTKVYKNYLHFSADVRDNQVIEEIFKRFKFDLIIHTAAQPSHDWAAKEPHTDFSVNANGTLVLLENYRKHSPEGVFIFTSTNKVYGDAPNRLPLVEKNTRFEIDPRHPFRDGVPESMTIDDCTHSLFGVSKAAADLMVQEYGRYFNLMTGVFRGGCLTGSGHAGVEQHGFLSYLVKCIVMQRRYTIFGYKGKQVRDNIHANDLISAFNEFYRKPRVGEVYNMGGSRFANVSMLEAIKKIEGISGRKAKLEYVERNRIGDHIWYISSVSKFKSHYPGWNYKYDIDATIEDICRNSVFARKVFSFSLAKDLDFWKEKNWYFHNLLKNVFKEAVPEGARVLQIGYGLGDILANLYAKKAVSIDDDEHILMTSRRRYPSIKFIHADPLKVSIKEKFDYAIFPNSLDHFYDIQAILERVKKNLNDKGVVVATALNPCWEQLYALLEKLHLKRVEPARNLLGLESLRTIIEISGYEVLSCGSKILLPIHIPFISSRINRFAGKAKFLSWFCFEHFVVAKKLKLPSAKKRVRCSVVIECHDGADIERCVISIPKMGLGTEIVLVDNGCSENIRNLLESLARERNVKLVSLGARHNKSYAIRMGLDAASGEILITYDADMSVSAYELPRVYRLLAERRAGFVSATRFIYPRENKRWRQLNVIAHRACIWFFSWVLKQKISDTICVLKAFYQKDYKAMKVSNEDDINFGLLYAATERGLKIVELPVRDLGLELQFSWFNHALLLIRMGFVGFVRLRMFRIR